jgi:hypothetical protein
MRSFERFVCLDWSGQAVARPKGLAMAWCAPGDGAPCLAAPAGGWSRQGVLDWLLQHAAAGTSMLVGMDLSPAFPFADRGAYFPGLANSPRDARALWQAIDAECAEEDHLAASTFALKPAYRAHFRNQLGRLTETGAAFAGTTGRLRVVEERQRSAGMNPVSCFNLVGAAQVGKSSLTGMRLLHRLQGRVPIWPFDPIPENGPVIVEVYTTIAARAAGMRKGLSKIRDAEALDQALDRLDARPHHPLARYDDHATDAMTTAAWLRKVAADSALWQPPGLAEVAQTEGWTFGAL